ncbi:MAG: hypothetical protein K9G70_10115 [Prolixibacteraceae bacterium]|nr:hypothetical protein [Prolixibacteraceae bacterium]
MFGISDPGIYMAYLLVFLCVIFAVVYGIINWNKGGNDPEQPLEEDLKWEEEELRIKEDEA